MCLTKTIIHPLVSHYLSTKWGEERGVYFTLSPIGGALEQEVGLLRGFTVPQRMSQSEALPS